MERRAIIYTRISKDRTGAGLGVERQQADCQALADRLGWQVVGASELYADNDLSAYSGKPRPGYQRLLAALKEGRADAVLVWHTDRLHRSTVELEEYVTICEAHDVITQTVTAGPLDLATPTGRLVARQMGAVARYEVEHAIERMKRAKLQAVAAGKFTGGRRPFGYGADGMTTIEEEAAELRAAAEAVLLGESLHSITRDMNARGVVTSTGVRWKPTELRGCLLRPRNAGLASHYGKVAGPAEWPAILPEDLWRGVVAVLSDPARRTSPGGTLRYLGTSIYRCGVCGGTLRVSSDRRGTPVYRCRSLKHVNRAAATLDAYVTDALLLAIREVGVPVQRSGGDGDAHRLVQSAQAVREQIDEALNLWRSKVLTGPQFQKLKVSLDEELADLERRIGATVANGAITPLLIPGGDIQQLWDDASLDMKRAALREYLTVTVLPVATRGRRPGGGYFDPDAVEIVRRQAVAS